LYQVIQQHVALPPPARLERNVERNPVAAAAAAASKVSKNPTPKPGGKYRDGTDDQVRVKHRVGFSKTPGT